MMDQVTVETARRVIEVALAEDIGAQGDVTTLATVRAGSEAKAELIAREEGVVCGLPIAAMAFAAVDPAVRFEALLKEGEAVCAGDVLARVEGPAASILAAERTALNLLQHLSFVATLTSKAVSLVVGSRAEIFDTRKTTPGMRLLEKYAVKTGGGQNHRKSLSDAVLIKDNHIAAAGGIRRAVAKAREACGNLEIEVEAETLEQVREAITAGADTIMLDNMDAVSTAQAVQMIGGRAVVEASGGIGLQHVEEIAGCGVDRISMGSLTAGGRLDISLETTT